jgi:hypothetical protein
MSSSAETVDKAKQELAKIAHPEYGENAGRAFCRELLVRLNQELDKRKQEVKTKVNPISDQELEKILDADPGYEQLQSLIIAVKVIMGEISKRFVDIPSTADGYYLLKGFEDEDCDPRGANQHQARWIGRIIAEVINASKNHQESVAIDLPELDETVYNDPDIIFQTFGYREAFEQITKAANIKVNFKSLGRYKFDKYKY